MLALTNLCELMLTRPQPGSFRRIGTKAVQHNRKYHAAIEIDSKRVWRISFSNPRKCIRIDPESRRKLLALLEGGPGQKQCSTTVIKL